MENFLSQLYCGQIHPAANEGKYIKELTALEKLSENILKKLECRLDDNAKAELKKFIDCRQELEFIMEEDAFAKGVSFAAEFLVSALG
ncbi:MAG: hypothetical protein IJX92_03785 [Clostridia bacterium]|nr:hypothetical protein [Clostridia bacterium]